jgi:hypothetical protein
MHKIALTYILIFGALNMGFILPAGPDRESKVEAASSIIPWEEHVPLSWYDFKGSAKNWTGISALTASAIEYSYDCQDDRLDVDIQAIFIKDESWVRSEAKTDYILAHEQLHFDITEIFARKLRREVARQIRSCDDVWKLDRIAGKIIEEWKDVQNQYDKDTHHSIDRELQLLWEEKVVYDLEAHEDYSMDKWVFRD